MSKEKFDTIDMIESFENDSDFRILKQKYESPNEFSIMGNKRREEWHSSFISWLLNPKQNHKLGIIPLKRFLELVESKSENLEIDKKDIANMSFETEHRTKDGRSIDVFGLCSSLVLVIENKIKAKETYKNGKAQSDAYYDYCKDNYKEQQRCYVLLKASSSTRLENKEFISITYQELFDEVIKPTCEYCKEQNISDTERVLEQYSLDISNPFSDIILADTQKDLSNRIRNNHSELLKKIRATMSDINRDNESDICKFFDKNRKYINNVILMRKNIILPKTEKVFERGVQITNLLIDYNYIIPNKTELIYKRREATCIIGVAEDHTFYAGYYKKGNDGKEVDSPKHPSESGRSLRGRGWG